MSEKNSTLKAGSIAILVLQASIFLIDEIKRLCIDIVHRIRYCALNYSAGEES